MVKEQYSWKDIDEMAENLLLEGWSKDENLPKSWFKRHDITMSNGKPTSRYNYLSSEFQLFESTKAVINFMKKSELFGDQDIKNFSSTVDIGHKEMNLQKYKWSLDQKILPLGWKLRTVQISDGQKTYYLSPDGTTFITLLGALMFMIKEKYSQDDVDLMSNNLLKDGWRKDENLPNGWFMKPKGKKDSGVTYLTDTFQLIHSTKSAVSHLNASDQYNQEDIDKLEFAVEHTQKELAFEKHVWSEGQGKIPNNWKMRTCT